MSEYIDREALLEQLKTMESYNTSPMYRRGYDDCVEVIKRVPVADVVPAVHGRWKFLGPNRLVRECMCGTCSVCKMRSKYITNVAICPNCGALMKGNENNV